MQTLVEEKLGISPQALVLEKNENGKPTVQGHPAFYFNLSHAGDYVVLAHGDVPLGVDIEQIRCGACIKACPKDAIHYQFLSGACQKKEDSRKPQSTDNN